MSNVALASTAWLAFATHIAVWIVARRRLTEAPIVPLLNLAVALCVLGYWIPRWFSYATKGVTWYATDQLVPLYALIVTALAILVLTGRLSNGWPQTAILAVHTIVLLGAALLFSFFRMNRLM